MNTSNFVLEGEYIELTALLKATNVAMTGGHAKILINDELVKVNGELELRKRYKVRKGDVIDVNDEVVIKVE